MATTIGDALREARKKRGLSLRDLEKMTKMSSSQISQIEKGVRVDPAFGTVVKLARAIGVTTDSLISREAIIERDILSNLEQAHADVLRILRRLDVAIAEVKETKSAVAKDSETSPHLSDISAAGPDR